MAIQLMWSRKHITKTGRSAALISGNFSSMEMFLCNKLLGIRMRSPVLWNMDSSLEEHLISDNESCTAGKEKSCQSTGSMPVASFVDGVWYGGVGNAGVKPTVAQEKKYGCSKFMFTDMKAMLTGRLPQCRF